MSVSYKSMAGITGGFRVTLIGSEEPLEVRVIGADIARWEQNNKASFFAGDSVSFSRLCYIAWAALKRTQQTEMKFEEFIASLEDLERESEDDDEETEDEGDGVELPAPTEAAYTA